MFVFGWMTISIIMRGNSEASTDLLHYFTYWNMVANFAAYLILVVAHALNNDFGKHWYVEIDPKLIDDS